ncbi:MAG: dihydrolipoyl dehydrogenase [Spirochaetota bacterium]
MADRRAVVVVGAGPAGYAAAFMAADKGKQVTIVDPEENPGGVCLYRGCIPTKALLHVVKTKHEVEMSSDWGLSFGEGSIDVDRLRSWKDDVVQKLTRGTGQLAKRRKIEHIHGMARFADPHTLEVTTDDGEQSVSAEQIIIATGAQPRMLPMIPADDERVWTAERALDIPFVPERLLVIGAGYIGLEMSYTYQGLGSKVDIVEMTEHLMPGADRDLVDVFEKANRKKYNRILLSTLVDTAEPGDDGLTVSFKGEGAPDGSATYDAILLATGRGPKLDRLGLEDAGIELNDEGFIRVDAQMRTSVDTIFAVGDVAGPPLLAHKGKYEGRIAGAVVAGDENAAADTATIPAVEYTDPEIAWVGLTETEAEQQGRKVDVSRFPWTASGRALTMGRRLGLTKLIIDPETERILGVAIAGPHAGELIAEGALAIEMAATVRDLELTIHPHPTLSETMLGAAERYLGVPTDI